MPRPFTRVVKEPPVHRVAHALSLFCLLSLAVVSPAAADETGEVTIAAYNLENAFDVFDDPYTGDEGTDVKLRWELEAIAKSLALIDADVVVFSEVENEGILKSIVSQFLANKGYEHISVMPTNSGRGINLGVISRLPIRSITSYRWQTLTHPDAPDRTWRFARDLMRVDIELPDDRLLHVFNVHFKSNGSSPGDPNSKLWRTAEAMRTKEIVRGIVAAAPDALVVVAGDFNSNFETRPEQDRPWPAMAHLLEPEADDTQVLTDLHAGLSDEARVTIPGDGRFPPATFDYVLATPAMAKRVVKGSAKVLQDAELTAGSDHYPVYATFDLSE